VRAGDKGQAWLWVLQPSSPAQDWQSFSQAAWLGTASSACPETCFSSLHPMAASHGAQGCAGTLLWGGGHSMAWGTHVPLLYWYLKHIYLRAFRCGPCCVLSGMMRAASCASQPGDKDRDLGLSVSLVPSSLVPPPYVKRGGREDPGEHPVLPSSTTLSQEVSWGPGASFPAPESCRTGWEAREHRPPTRPSHAAISGAVEIG